MKYQSNNKSIEKVNEQTIDERQAIELNEKELEQVNGGCHHHHHHHHCYRPCYDYYYYYDCYYYYDYCW